jgi:hypothetical protein
MTAEQSSRSTRRYSVIPGLAWLLLLLVFAVGVSHRIRPAWNLDSVFYAGASYLQTDPDVSRAHQRVYGEVRAVAPKPFAQAITSGSEYRRRVAGSEEAFSGQLPFYTAKPLYVSAVTVVRSVSGEGAVVSAFRVSQVCFVLLLFAMAAAGRCFAPMPVSVGIACVFGLGVPVVETAELATPDTLCAALVVASFAALASGRIVLGGGTGVLAVLTRPDAAVFVLLAAILPAMLIRPADERRRAVVVATVVLFAVPLPSLLGETYSWTMAMRQTFFGATTDLVGLREPLSWPEYLLALEIGVGGHMSLNHGGGWPYLLALVGAGVVVVVRRERKSPAHNALLVGVMCWGAAGVHTVLFPLVADRLLLPAYGLSLLVVAAIAGDWVAKARGRP